MRHYSPGISRRTDCTHSAVIVAKAAGAAPSNAVLHLHPRNKGAHAIGTPPSVDGTACLDVPVVRVDDELERLGVALENVGLVWIDVEGYEPQVFDGLARSCRARCRLASNSRPAATAPRAKRGS